MNEQDIERYEIQDQAITEPGLQPMEAKPTEAGQQAAAQALLDIRSRSFSGRNPELGKMTKCQVCGLRHRIAIVHAQVFAKRWKVENGKKVYTDELLIAGQTPETESLIEARKVRLIVGATPFKGKRRNPPLNKRANEFVQLVRNYLPDEYTQEDMQKARAKARRILVQRYGRFGFLESNRKVRKDVRKTD